MSATNKTTYLDLPQFIGTDVPSWLGDFNGAMEKIDTGYNNVDIKAGQVVFNESNLRTSGKSLEMLIDRL